MGIIQPRSSTALLRPVPPGIHGGAGSQGPSHPSRKSLNCVFSAFPSAPSLAVARFRGELASSGVYPPHLLLQALASVADLPAWRSESRRAACRWSGAAGRGSTCSSGTGQAGASLCSEPLVPSDFSACTASESPGIPWADSTAVSDQHHIPRGLFCEWPPLGDGQHLGREISSLTRAVITPLRKLCHQHSCLFALEG